jgi:REP element-mobilizing transposase RayT
MPQSLAKVVLHITFRTKNRKPFLRSPELLRALEGYVVGTLPKLRCPSIVTRSVEDHIHILCNLARTITIAKSLEEIKSSSSEWVKEQEGGPRNFYWQNGYGAFSVSESNVAQVKRYIASQEEHHRKMTFQEEFRLLLKRHNAEYDERFVWD